MIEDIIRLICAEGKSRARSPIHLALKEVMRSINSIMIERIADLERTNQMQIPEDEKERIIELILQAGYE